MKKYLAMLLAIAMMVAVFAGCGSSESAAEASGSGAASEETASFTWNGQKEVWSVLPTTAAAGLVSINDFMGELMEAEGFTYVKKDAEGIPANQVTIIEDAVAAGNVGALMVAAMDVDLLEEAVGQAIDAGIAVVYLGAEPTNYTIGGCVYTAYELTGMYAVQAASDWVAKRMDEGGNIPINADGQYEVAVDTYYGIADGVYRSNAIVGTIEADDTLTLVSETSAYGDEDPYTSAYSHAQSVLEANPDCHIFVTYEPKEAMGFNAAVMEYCEVNGLDVADYCIIPCYGEEDGFAELYNAALEDPSASAIKGYSTYGDAGDVETYGDAAALQATGAHLAEELLGICGVGDYSWEYGTTYYDTINAVNIYGFSQTWSMGDENPASQYKQ